MNSKTGERWEVSLKNRLEMELMGDVLSQLVEGERLAPQNRWD